MSHYMSTSHRAIANQRMRSVESAAAPAIVWPGNAAFTLHRMRTLRGGRGFHAAEGSRGVSIAAPVSETDQSYLFRSKYPLELINATL